MDIIYTVQYDDGYDNAPLCGIFSTKEEAELYIKYISRSNHLDYYIDEFALNEGDNVLLNDRRGSHAIDSTLTVSDRKSL